MRNRKKTYPNLDEFVIKALKECTERFDRIKEESGPALPGEDLHFGEALLHGVIHRVRNAYPYVDPLRDPQPSKMTIWRCIQRMAKEGKLIIEKRPVEITIDRCYVRLLSAE